MAYYTAGVAVVHDFSAGKAPRNRQRFFQSHDDDILCMTIDPSRNYCATGQVAPLKRAQGGPCKPTVSVWDVHNMCELHLPPTSYHCHLPPTTYHPPPTTHHLPPTTYHPPPTTLTRCELVQLEHEPVKDDNGVEQSMNPNPDPDPDH